MNEDLELSFKMTEEEKERIKKILLGNGGLRHYLLKTADGTELDVVDYKEYKKLESKIASALTLLDNYQNNLYSKTTRETLDDDIERTIKLLKVEDVEMKSNDTITFYARHDGKQYHCVIHCSSKTFSTDLENRTSRSILRGGFSSYELKDFNELKDVVRCLRHKNFNEIDYFEAK